MRFIDESEYRSIESAHSIVAGICLGLFAVMVGLPFIFGGGWLIQLMRLIGG